MKRLIENGFINLSLSRNTFDNDIERFEDNKLKLPSQLTLSYQSRETENKFRADINKTVNGWKIAYGLMAQLSSFDNSTYNVFRKELKDAGLITGTTDGVKTCYCLNLEKIRELKAISETFINEINIPVNINCK